VSRLQSNLVGQLELRPCHETPQACPLRQDAAAVPELPQPRRRCLALTTRDAAREWLSAVVTNADDMALLRRFVLRDAAPGPVAWLSAHQIVDLAADKIARGDLCLVVSEDRASGRVVSAVPAPPPLSMSMTPSMAHSRVDDVVERPVAAEPAELTNDVNQAKQAAALERAARGGAPFVEVCPYANQPVAP
jgi:hypothetical protein